MKTPLAILLLLLLAIGCGKNGAQGPHRGAPASPQAEARNPEPPTTDSKTLIADPILQAAIRKSVKKPTGALTNADLAKVIDLNLGRNNLTEIPKGLEKLPQLVGLGLKNNQLTNVTGLEKLTQLELLYLGSNEITDVTGLQKLTLLTDLGLENNQLTELPKGLEKLTQLTILYLENNQLTDVTGLEKLTQLTLLCLNNNQLIDVTGLEKLTVLSDLRLPFNPNLTKAQIDQLKKALPKCRILSSH